MNRVMAQGIGSAQCVCGCARARVVVKRTNEDGAVRSMLLSHSFQASYVLMPSSKGWVNSMVKAASMITNLAHTTKREKERYAQSDRETLCRHTWTSKCQLCNIIATCVTDKHTMTAHTHRSKALSSTPSANR